MLKKKVLIDEPLALDIEMYQDSELLLEKHGDCSATINCISTSVVSIGLGYCGTSLANFDLNLPISQYCADRILTFSSHDSSRGPSFEQLG